MNNRSIDSSPLKYSRLVQLMFIGWVLWDAYEKRWLSDDAFISFRYAKNWSESSGLVYNVGEYVEGYTNLLWTVVLGLGMMVGVQPEFLSHTLSIGALAVMLLVLTRFASKSGWSLPCGCWVQCSCSNVATSGLKPNGSQPRFRL